MSVARKHLAITQRAVWGCLLPLPCEPWSVLLSLLAAAQFITKKEFHLKNQSDNHFVMSGNTGSEQVSIGWSVCAFLFLFRRGTGNDVIEEHKYHKHHNHHKNLSRHHGYFNDLKSSQLHSRRKRSIGKISTAQRLHHDLTASRAGVRSMQMPRK